MTAISDSDIEIIVYICSFFSALACLSVILCYYFFPQVRTFVTKIIFYLAISELLSSIFRYVQDCKTFAALSQFTNLSSFCWISSVAIVQYLTVVKHYRILYKYELIFHIFNWGFPLIDTILIGISNSYGEAGIWCWIKSDDTIARWVGYFLWLLLSMCILFYCFGSIVFILEHRLTSSLMPSASLSHQNTKQFQRELVLYLTVIVFVRIWSVMDRLYDLVSDNEAPDLIKGLHALGSSLEGFVNCLLLFFNNRTLRQRLIVGASEKWRRYQQTKDVKSLTETESLFPHQQDDASVQGYSSLDHERDASISTTTFVKGVREYSELFPHWSDDYIIDEYNKPDPIQSHHMKQQHEAPKSSKLLQSIKIHISTWDSNGSTLYVDDFEKWLPNDPSNNNITFQANSNINDTNESGETIINKKLPEIVCISTQSLQLSETAWEQRIQQQIGFTQYVKIIKHNLRDLHFILFARKDIKHLISNPQVASTGRSYEQFYGNKGGLAIGIDFAGMKIGFVSIDLLNDKICNIKDKSRNIQGISHGLWIERPEIDLSHQFNAIFWMGNLNSCIENGSEKLNDIIAISEDEKKDIEEKESFIESLKDSVYSSNMAENIHEYYKNDQCFLLRKEGKIFYQNHESDITFNPTYCIIPDKQQVERYDRSRTPRWCSRILYGVPPHPMIEIVPQTYNSVKHLFGSSNHRAVYGEFVLNRYNSWFPIPQTCWKFYLKNFRIVLYKTNRNNNNNNNNNENASSQSPKEINEPATMYYIPKVHDYNALYLTIHAPFLNDTIRTPLAKLVQETSEFVVVSIPSRIDFEKLFDDYTVRNMGNFCLYIVLRDENLLGDMDSIAACSLPLLYDEDVNKDITKEQKLLMNDVTDEKDTVIVNVDSQNNNNNENKTDVPLNSVEKVTFYRYQTPLTCDTAKRGRVEGLIAMRQKPVNRKH